MISHHKKICESEEGFRNKEADEIKQMLNRMRKEDEYVSAMVE